MVTAPMAKRKPRAPTHRRRPGSRKGESGPGSGQWLYGWHAVLAALANPDRNCRRLMAAAGAAERLTEMSAALDTATPQVEIVDRGDLEAVLPPGAVHQGVVVQADPLPAPDFKALVQDLAEIPDSRVVVLDQATDPRNIGAVLRSAAAFGARAVIMQDRHAPEATAALAKAASGALETVPLVRVVNIARALRALKEADFWLIGLDGGGDIPLAGASPGGRITLVIGAEGGGLRRLTREACDALVRIPIGPAVESLNLSTAAAIALYELARDPS